MRLFCRQKRVYTLRKKWINLMVIVFFAIALYLFIYNTCYSGTIKEKARVKANYVAISAINNAVDTILQNEAYAENSFFVIDKKQDGTIASVTLNSVTANRFKADFSQTVLEQITKYRKETILMSPFSSYGYTYVPFGIRVPVLVIPIEILSSDFVSELKSNGINQTLYKLSIKAKIAVKLLLPVGSESFDVTTTVPLVQTVIVGDVPDAYTNVEGAEDTGANTILDIAS